MSDDDIVFGDKVSADVCTVSDLAIFSDDAWAFDVSAGFDSAIFSD
ncbi:MAG: hypothetical protein S4CHLAM81_03430 [Chlamydiales bacterium]|nr:hypothetical protein [Chlamydiales bacterium]MCH9635133.1 hypothetical protein [Chlamydiales bacterium]